MYVKIILSAMLAWGVISTQNLEAQNSNDNQNKSEVKMIKKIKKGNKLIEDGVVAGYKIIENGVVTGYKKFENGVVTGYKKVEDKCVDTLFAKEGETTKEARIRLKNISGNEEGKSAE